MLKPLVLILALFLLSGTAQAIDDGKIVKRNGISYEIYSETPYTGKVTRLFWSNGFKETEYNLVDGKLNGLTTWWYENGQKEDETTFVHGKMHGLATEWYENGQKKAEGNYVDGKKHGLTTMWYENGQKQAEVNYVDGKSKSVSKFGNENKQLEAAQAHPAESLDTYVRELSEVSGELYCKTESGGERHPFGSCASFSALKEKGCFGYTTIEIKNEMRVNAQCSTAHALATSQGATTHYFATDSAHWWKALPAEVIPMSGGIYNDESWDRAAAERQELVAAGEMLGELTLSEIEARPGYLAATLKTTKEECGETRDRLIIETDILADVDGDGVAELILIVSRLDESDTCWLGTGNSIGAARRTVVKKESPHALIVVLKGTGIF